MFFIIIFLRAFHKNKQETRNVAIHNFFALLNSFFCLVNKKGILYFYDLVIYIYSNIYIVIYIHIYTYMLCSIYVHALMINLTI